MGRSNRQESGKRMNSRDKYIQEINRIQEAINNSKSKYLIRDYKKALKRMKRELDFYDRQVNLQK